MASLPDPRELRLHFDGPIAAGHLLPAEILVTAVQQVQRIVHLLAKEHRGEPAGKRLMVSADIRARFGLVCRLPAAGGYELPISIGAPSCAEDEEIVAVAERFQVVSRSLADIHAFEHLVSDAQYRRWLVDAYKAIQPPPHLDLELTVEDTQGNAILHCSRVQDVPSYRPEADTRHPTERGRVVGTLVRMEFAKQSIALAHRGAHVLAATYTAEVEPALLSYPRRLIQVRGDVCYDAAGEPVSIADIDEVAEVDESPMEVEEIVCGNVRYVANTPLRFDVAFDQADALYDLRGPFGILLSAASREDLADALEAELNLLFADYAEGDPAHMASDARKLREQIRRRFGLR